MNLVLAKYGNPVLERPAQPVTEFGPKLEALIDAMFAFMYVSKGVGLAAPQVGLPLRLAVLDVTSGTVPEARLVLVNPEITHQEGQLREMEGCLSVPGRGHVTRPEFVKVRAQSAKGEWFETQGRDLLARAFCHEVDHLNGILFLEHLGALRRDMILSALRKQKRLEERKEKEAQRTGGRK